MRRHALVGLLALALVLSMAACSQERADPEPAPAPAGGSSAPAMASAVPEDFPLSAGMRNGAGDEVRITAKSVGMRALDFCGRKPLRGLRLTDRRTAEASGPEYANTRDLMLFAEPGPPAAVLADIRATASDCTADRTGPGSRLLTSVTDSGLDEDGATIVRTYEQDGRVGVGAEVIAVVVVGRALLVTSTYSEWDPATNLDEGVADVTAGLERTVAAMAQFGNGSDPRSVTQS